MQDKRELASVPEVPRRASPVALTERGRVALAARRQWLVLSAMIRRESQVRHGTSINFGFLLGMLEPLVIIGAICLLFHLLNRPPIYGNSMILFVATGVFPVYLFIHTSGKVQEPLHAARSGLYPIEAVLDGVLAHATLHAVVSAAVAILFFAALYVGGERQAAPYDTGAAVKALLVIYGFGVGVGIINVVIGQAFPLWGVIWPALSRASVHFSGIYYVVDYFPPEVRSKFAMLPMLHGVEWFRKAFYPFYPAVTLDRSFMIWGMFVSLFLGLLLQRVFRLQILRR